MNGCFFETLLLAFQDVENLRQTKEIIDNQLKELGFSPTSGPHFPPPAEMKRQHALSVGQSDFHVRDRTQTVDSYTGDLTELPVYTGSDHYSKNRMSMLSRIRTTSESEGVSSRKPDTVCVMNFAIKVAFDLSILDCKFCMALK